MSASQLVGLVLAAGKSTRMGRTKQLIQIPTAGHTSKALVALAFDSIAWACEHMVVVVDTQRERVIEHLAGRDFTAVTADGTRQMSESLFAGLRATAHSWPDHAVLLQLGDHPAVRRDTISQLRDRSLQDPQRTIIPTFQGKGGHPILIPPNVIGQLIDNAGRDPLDAYWRAHPELCIRVDVDDDLLTRDVDNPTQLAQELARRSNR